MAHVRLVARLEQRYQIARLFSKGFSQTKIADFIGKDRSVVCLELKRNSDQRNVVYRAELAQKKARIRQLISLKVFYLIMKFKTEQRSIC
jgi:IS30 family transposase